MISLFCDLDNTIIYSHRKKLDVPKRVVEKLNGSAQSYMTEKTFDFLSTCMTISTIPVTTRTFNQYDRLKTTLEILNCEYVVILNGAVLINNGEIDQEWLSESEKLAAGSEVEMDVAAAALEKYGVKIRQKDALFTYGSTLDPQGVVDRVEGEIKPSLIHIFCDSRKVYCTPSIINKGSAVKRLKNKLLPELSVGAGDSKNDLPMLNSVDIPIVPQTLEAFVSNPNRITVSQTEILSDVVCDEIDRLTKSFDGSR